MKGDVKRFDSNHGTNTIAKREIAGNTYLVVVDPRPDSSDYSHHVAVLADTVDGSDHGFPNSTDTYVLRSSDYDTLVSGKVGESEKLAPVISKGVNKAVGMLTDKLEETKSNEDAVLGALEANAEVHEDNS